MKIIKYFKKKSFYIKYIVLYKRNEKRVIKAKIPVDFQQVTLNNYTDIISYKGRAYAKYYRKLLYSDRYYGLYVYYNGRVIAHGWIIYNKKEKVLKVKRYIELPFSSGFIFHCAVHPDYRGNKIYQALLTELYTRSEMLGINTIYIDTGIDNLCARRAIEKSGCHFLVDIKLLYLRSHVICRLC